MLYAILSLWFVVSGSPSHINHEKFDERVKAQRVARNSPVTSLLIWSVTTCPEESWSLQDTPTVKRYKILLRLAAHSKALKPLCQIRYGRLWEFTDSNPELRRLMVDMMAWYFPEYMRCSITSEFLTYGQQYARADDCNFRSFPTLWDDVATEVTK